MTDHAELIARAIGLSSRSLYEGPVATTLRELCDALAALAKERDESRSRLTEPVLAASAHALEARKQAFTDAITIMQQALEEIHYAAQRPPGPRKSCIEQAERERDEALRLLAQDDGVIVEMLEKLNSTERYRFGITNPHSREAIARHRARQPKGS